MSEDKSQSARVLGMVGSPRRGSNTHILVDEILRGAADAGAETMKIDLTALRITPCDACDTCRRKNRCIHEDDFEQGLDAMRKSQVWVFGTPVYWWGPTAQMKLFIDRWYGVVDELQMLPVKKVILAIPFGDDAIETARHTIGMFQDSLEYLNKKIDEIILAPGADGRGEIKNFPEVLKKAYEAGKRSVS